jgi:hypothetical protein
VVGDADPAVRAGLGVQVARWLAVAVDRHLRDAGGEERQDVDQGERRGREDRRGGRRSTAHSQARTSAAPGDVTPWQSRTRFQHGAGTMAEKP